MSVYNNKSLYIPELYGYIICLRRRLLFSKLHPSQLNPAVWQLVFVYEMFQSSHKDLWRSWIILYFQLKCFM